MTTTDNLTAQAQPIADQPDGPGRRIGRKGELTIIAPVRSGGAEVFRKRLGETQAQAGYWEPRVGTVDNFRVLLFDDDTRMLVTLTYDGDFLPYLSDIGKAQPWLDEIFQDIVEGYVGFTDPSTPPLVVSLAYSADIFFHANPDLTVRDVQKLKRLGDAFAEVLDAAS